MLAQQRVQKTLQQTLQHRWQAGPVPSALANQIEAVALAQRAVREALTDSSASVLRELHAQQDAIRRSRIAAEARLQRREDWVAQLAQLDQDALAKLDDALSSVLRDVSDGDPAPGLTARASDELQRAVPLQQHVVERLQTLVWELRQQDALQARVQQLQQLRAQQQTLFGETTALAEVTISRTVDSMPAAQRDKLRALVEQQLELARQAEQIVAGMRDAAAERDAAEAARLMAAQQAAVAGGLSARMRLAAQELQLNRVGNATQQQQAVDALLEQVLSLLQREPQNTWQTAIATPTQQSDAQAEMQAALPAEPPQRQRGGAASGNPTAGHAAAPTQSTDTAMSRPPRRRRRIGRRRRAATEGSRDAARRIGRAIESTAICRCRRYRGSGQMIESISLGTARQRRRVYVRRRMRSVRSFLCCAVVMSAIGRSPVVVRGSGGGASCDGGAQDSMGTSNLDERLFRDLGGLDADDAARGSEIQDRPAPGVVSDPAVPRDLSRRERDQASIVQQMLQVQARLSRADAGAETQRMQRQILTQLEQWLEPQGDSSHAGGFRAGQLTAGCTHRADRSHAAGSNTRIGCRSRRDCDACDDTG